MSTVHIDNAPRHFVIEDGEALLDPDLVCTRDHIEPIAGQGARAEAQWSDSPGWGEIDFEPGTHPLAARTLDLFRASGRRVRLIFGDTHTGESRLDDRGVVGWIRRSMGTPHVPLLIEAGTSNAGAIACASLLAIIDWEFGECVWHHPAYRQAELRIEFRGEDEQPWCVLRREEVVGSFGELAKADAWLAFMRGASVEPRVFR